MRSQVYGGDEMIHPYEQVSPNHRRCARCSKVMRSRMGLHSHLIDKHRVTPTLADFAPVGRVEQPTEHEESFADRAIAAQLDHAMGVKNDDYEWLVEPFE